MNNYNTSGIDDAFCTLDFTTRVGKLTFTIDNRMILKSNYFTQKYFFACYVEATSLKIYIYILNYYYSTK